MFSTIFATIFFTALVVDAHDGQSRVPARHRQQARSVFPRSAKNFTLVDKYQGANFFDGWDFFSDADPTNGNVDFATQQEAFDGGLAFTAKDGTTVLAVDDRSAVPVGGNRKSVRISSKKTYDGGLFIADFWAMPHGCGVWPAWWSVGPNWPSAGEIDVVEGINTATTNQMTLHTSEGCTLTTSTNPQAAAVATGQILGKQCATINGDNTGCAFKDTDARSFGHGFNILGGGVFAHLWDNTGIKIWHFARTEIPADITAGFPNPSSWPLPSAAFSAASCDMASHFHDHALVLDTTICGDLAGPAYGSSGCPGTCAEIVANPGNFAFAKWQINYISVFQ